MSVFFAAGHSNLNQAYLPVLEEALPVSPLQKLTGGCSSEQGFKPLGQKGEEGEEISPHCLHTTSVSHLSSHSLKSSLRCAKRGDPAGG